jgi:hypothetical protein
VPKHDSDSVPASIAPELELDFSAHAIAEDANIQNGIAVEYPTDPIDPFSHSNHSQIFLTDQVPEFNTIQSNCNTSQSKGTNVHFQSDHEEP